MENIIHTDVLICGGGPAGASAALSLLEYTERSVMLIEQSGFDQLKVGEQVSPAIFDLMDYLKVDQSAFPAETKLQSYTHLGAWGSDHLLSRHSINNIAGDSFQLDRGHFDLMLVEAVSERGGKVLPRTKLVEAKQSESGDWEVVLRHKTEGTVEVRAKYLLDATGRNAFLARHFDLPSTQVDQLVGVGTFLEFDADRKEVPEVVLETCPEGWWYTAPLPGGKMAVTLFTDADLVAKMGLSDPEKWNSMLNKTRHIRLKTSGGRSHSGIWVRNAFSRLISQEKLERFLSIGDAALSVDPLASIGIGFALTSGCHAARALEADLSGQPELVDAFHKSLKDNFQDFRKNLAGYYTREQRWLDAPFWARRQALAG